MKDKSLLQRLTLIQNALHVKKGRKNNFGKYMYRSAEDILEAIKPLTKEYGVTIYLGEMYLENNVIETTATIVGWEDPTVDITATAIVGVEKAGGMALPQAFGAASSYGKKYALGNLLLIDDTADADATNTHDKKGAPKAPSAKDLTDLGF